ncbi:Type I restriction enzyme EcoKI specificity protein [Serratia marcescens]|uniref:restriction endonuclease subunit S n=1 Tax=Serratia marcescens TaxID=615 RepID=UPI0007455045|nr:restriction endonuclease subunit S [Serratia marcescens]CVG46051.1 Type I restriction enzyme EcoKI specificity protein [Serratia marcescens]
MGEIILPEGWSNCTLADIAEVNPKKIEAEKDINAGFVPMSHAPTNYNGKLKFEEKTWGEIGKSYTNFKNDDVIFAKVTPCFENGKAAIVKDMPNDIGAGSSEFYVLRARNQEIPASYLLGIIKTRKFMQEGAGNMTGAVGLRRVPRAFVESFPLILPPLAEQKIIADKLDTLLAQVDSAKARLEQIPQILKRFRQTVLAAAVSGKLTEEWREQNKISSDWKSVQFLELITKLRSGSGDTPSDNVCGIPILRSSAIRPQIINYEDVRYLSSEETLNEDNYLKNGDLLFTRLSGSADYVGNCALVKGLTKKYQYPDRLFCARLKDQRNANYLEYFCSSNIFREHIIKSIKSSAGHQRITLNAIRTAQIFIPDYLEQTEIVRRVEQLFAYADGIEKQVQNALERVNNLTQSILAKAFRGELTAQWQAENPDLTSGENSAQALLAKIQQQRSNTKTIKRSKGNS